MSIRRAIVEVDLDGLNVSEFCQAHGVSRWFFYELRRRYRQDGEGALAPRSRAPRRVANKTPVDVEDAIVAARKDLDQRGLDCGAESIWDALEGLNGLPSSSTIWRILMRRGFITPEPAKAPKGAGRRFEAERANECWQLDDTSWELADGSEVKILNVLDDHSRLLGASRAATSCTGTFALDTVAGAATILGWPAWFLSDNAAAFRHVLAPALGSLGVTAGHSRPYHPQTCGKVERFHQTLKRWLAKQPPAATIAELQTQLDIFRHLYNHQRAHRALGRRRPADAWATAPKTGPSTSPIGTTTRTYTATVAADGRVMMGRRTRIQLGNTHAGRRALIVTTNNDCHVFIDARLARTLTIDPTKTNQPLYPRPGRPTKL